MNSMNELRWNEAVDKGYEFYVNGELQADAGSLDPKEYSFSVDDESQSVDAKTK